MPDRSQLYYGDNLDVLRLHIPSDSVDLVYLDPPFKSNQDYNVLFREASGAKARAQVMAFEDTWTWDQSASAAYESVVEAGGTVATTMRAFRMMLGDTDMLAYLAMMAPRLIELRRVLKDTGSIFLHCDATASAHLRLLMDSIFGHSGFRNEIIWCYTGPSSPGQRQFSRKHDTIHWYSKGPSWTFNADAVRVPHSAKTQANYKPGLTGSGFVEPGHKIHPGGKIPEDWWQIAIAPRGAEYLGYPTQKPEALLERIILGASKDGDVILDPFCGCGTATVVAERHHRRWIGIDVTHVAVALIKGRLLDRIGPSVDGTYDVIGEPTNVEDAEVLAAESPMQFQAWALGLVGARLGEVKRGADHGIDGRLLFHDVPSGPTKEIIFSVKAGRNISVQMVRDLRGVIEREKAEIGVLLSFAEPTRPMRTEAASAGFYNSPWGKHPRLQLFTVGELLEGVRVDYPAAAQTNVTFRRAPRARRATAPAPRLL